MDPSGLLRYPKIDGAFRISGSEGYSGNFGYQWNNFAKTQIDKFNGTDITEARLQAETEWKFDDLDGDKILEIGSGAGRFTQVLLDRTRASIYYVDYSEAVSANYSNNGPNERLKLFQASVYELPFRPMQFDKVLCVGVLQHTPDIEKTIKCLADMVKPGGELVVDFYPILS